MTAEREQSNESDNASVDLVLVGDHLNPIQLTSALGIQPSRSWSKGESYLSKSGQTLARPNGLWAVRAEAQLPEEAARDLIARVSFALARMRDEAARQSLSFSLSIAWFPDGGQGGFDMQGETLRTLVEKVDSVHFYYA
jgi:hypothetical protein